MIRAVSDLVRVRRDSGLEKALDRGYKIRQYESKSYRRINGRLKSTIIKLIILEK